MLTLSKPTHAGYAEEENQGEGIKGPTTAGFDSRRRVLDDRCRCLRRRPLAADVQVRIKFKVREVAGTNGSVTDALPHVAFELGQPSLVPPLAGTFPIHPSAAEPPVAVQEDPGEARSSHR
jgi:hypothetical protein